MSDRAKALAIRIEQGVEELASLVEGLSEQEWTTIVPNEEREVGTLVHHVAASYPVEVDLAAQLASGSPIEGVTWEVLDNVNAEHARKHARVDKSEVLMLLRENGKAAADRVRKFSDAELDSAEKVSLNANAPLTTQFFIEDHALRHSFAHLESIREALNK